MRTAEYINKRNNANRKKYWKFALLPYNQFDEDRLVIAGRGENPRLSTRCVTANRWYILRALRDASSLFQK